MSNREQYLDGRHAVVTGANSGIGTVIAARLADAGARLTLMGRNLDTLHKAQTQIPGSNIAVIDITDEASVHTAFNRAREATGPVDILVNSAGKARSAEFTRTTMELWQAMLDTNLTGTFRCCQEALPDMLGRGWGRIVNIASTAGVTGCPFVTAYSASKHGVIGLTRSLALEIARTEVTINAICPGFTDTDFLNRAINNIVDKTGRSFEQASESLLSVNPQHRFIDPAEIAETVAWLCREESRSMTGQAISIAGGEIL